MAGKNTLTIRVPEELKDRIETLAAQSLLCGCFFCQWRPKLAHVRARIATIRREMDLLAEIRVYRFFGYAFAIGAVEPVRIQSVFPASPGYTVRSFRQPSFGKT
jgi:hypothetical protein